jgi:phage baseplate assembly protein W
MGKLDPIVSEFETEEEAQAYDRWFRAQVEAALASQEPRVPHEQVRANIQAILDKHLNARPDLGA